MNALLTLFAVTLRAGAVAGVVSYILAASHLATMLNGLPGGTL